MRWANGARIGIAGVVVGFAVAAVSAAGLAGGLGTLPGAASVHDFLGSSLDSQLLEELLEGALWLAYRRLRSWGRTSAP